MKSIGNASHVVLAALFDLFLRKQVPPPVLVSYLAKLICW